MDFTWDGNGDPNNSGNWSDPLNWDLDSGYPDGLDDAGILVGPTVTRTVTVDVAVSVGAVQLDPAAVNDMNRLRLGADMLASNVDWTAIWPVIELNGYALTSFGEGGPSDWFPELNGDGQFVKLGPVTTTLNQHDGFTGGLIFSNGVVKFRSSAWSGMTGGLTVADGGAAWLENPSPDGFIADITLNGHGSGAYGALHFTYATYTVTGAVTIASAARIKVGSAITITFTGDILGTDVLTLEPTTGTIDLQNNAISHAGQMIVTNGRVVLSGNMPNVTNIWVDSGGIFEALPSQIPSATVVETNGGVWVQAYNATWTGNGDGINWSDVTNWAPNINPSNVATIGTPAGVRTVVVDTAVSVDTLVLAPVANNRIRLDADMTIDFVDSSSQPTIDMNGNTLTVSRSTPKYLPSIDGSGHFVKTTADEIIWSTSGGPDLDALVTISNGRVYFRTGDWSGITNMVINDGGTLYVEQNQGMPQRMEVNGPGLSGQGALRFRLSQAAGEMSGAITVASDATIRNDSSIATATLAGDINGPGILTLYGPGIIDVSGTNIAYDGTLIVTNVTVYMIGIAPAITNITVKNAGVLVGTVVHFPGVVDGATTNVIVEPGGLWIQEPVGQWDGNGNPDNSGNWSDGVNWTGDEVPTAKAILPDPTIDRFVTNDVPSSIDILHMRADNGNHLVVNAPLNIGSYEAVAAGGTPRCENNSLVTLSNSPTGSWLFNMYGGTGTYVYVGSAQLTANNSSGFTGTVIVSNDTFFVRSALSGEWGDARVVDGATLKVESPGFPGNYFGPPNLTIAGSGDQNGALWNSANHIAYSNLTIAADAVVYGVSPFVMTFNGTLAGPGAMIKSGTGTMDLNGIWSYSVAGSQGNSVTVTNGTLDISDCTFAVTNKADRTAREFVVIDKSTGTLVGEFAATNMPSSWQLIYAGTVDNPNAVVLLAAGSGSLLLIR